MLVAHCSVVEEKFLFKFRLDFSKLNTAEDAE